MEEKASAALCSCVMRVVGRKIGAGAEIRLRLALFFFFL